MNARIKEVLRPDNRFAVSSVDRTGARSNVIAGQLALPTQGATGGILLGGDTQLYRGAANLLYLGANDSLALQTSQRIQFRDSGLLIRSDDNGHLDISADISIDLNTPVTVLQNVATGSLPAGPEGAIAYDSTLNKLVVWTGAAWEVITSV